MRGDGNLHWTREVALSGPADTLNGRWRVRRVGSRWEVFDLRTQRVVGRRGYAHQTMRLAQAEAERVCRHVQFGEDT